MRNLQPFTNATQYVTKLNSEELSNCDNIHNTKFVILYYYNNLTLGLYCEKKFEIYHLFCNYMKEFHMLVSFQLIGVGDNGIMSNKRKETGRIWSKWNICITKHSKRMN